MDRISKTIRGWLTKLFSLELPQFSKITIQQSVIDNIIEIAKENSPKEFVALLEGKVRNNNLVVYGLVYQPFHASERSTLMRMNLPTISHVVGSVHSHPSSNTRPSNADLTFFNKSGVVHLIIGYPYKKENIAGYDLYGNKAEFEVVSDA